MAHLPCDNCGGATNTFGSWDTPIKIICEKCAPVKQQTKIDCNYCGRVSPDTMCKLHPAHCKK